MPNRRRGEVPLILGDDRYTLCLTLGALAELEDMLQAGSVVGLAERFTTGHLSVRDLIALFGCALRGGGHDIDDAVVAKIALAGDFAAVVAAIEATLVAAFGETKPANPKPANP